MKEDEKKFFRTMVKYCRQMRNGEMYGSTMPRTIISIIDEFIHHKRCWYLLQKWSRLGFYNWGVCLDLGWLELDELPERYIEVLKEKER